MPYHLATPAYDVILPFASEQVKPTNFSPQIRLTIV